MRRKIRGQLGLGVFLLVGVTRQRASEPSMTILVYDYVGIDGETLRGAEGEADHVLRRAGVALAWRHCYSAADRKEAECPDVSPSTPALRLMPRFQLVPDQVRADTMGYWIGNLMTVSLEEADKVARSGVASVSQVLGLIIAHEVGHLLLGRAHSLGGIMRARWGFNEWSAARQGGLVFLSRQAEALRKELRSRSETAVAEGNVR